MASTSSREAALERRRALTNGGKKAAGRYTSGGSRVRTAADARPSRTTVPEPQASVAPVQAAPSRSPEPRPSGRTRPSLSLGSSAPQSQRSAARPVRNPSRDLVLARREALSRSGKRASTSRDRTRTDLGTTVRSSTTASPAPAEKPCKCQEHQASAHGGASRKPTATLSLSRESTRPSRRGDSLGSGERAGGDRRSSTPKRTAQHNPSRSLVLARREALAKRGKSAQTPTSTSAAAVARQGNPDLSTRELAQKVRELKSKVGSAGRSRNGGTRPTGPNRNGARQAAAADAPWKVGASATSGGQVVTGTQANRSVKTTGNEASTCRPITGTEYLGAEVFQTFCQSEPLTRPAAKVRVSATTHGNRVTGNEVGRSTKVTGDEPGTCQSITGTEYVSANQAAAWCGAATPSPRKVGQSQTQGGRPVSGVIVGRSDKVTGDESGSGRQITGDQYVTPREQQVAGRAPVKVNNLQTLRGTGVTGTAVGRSEQVTGDEAGSCRHITGDEYIGSHQFDRFCGARPAPEPAKVGFSITNRTQVVSGTRTGRSDKVTGDEPGTCKAITGTPYAGLEEAGNWCSSKAVQEIRQRTPRRMGTVMSGIQPGIGGPLTGAERGACEPISGTPYVGPDQLAEACAAAAPGDADFPQPLADSEAGSKPWQQFSVQSPAQAAQGQREPRNTVTGISYEQNQRITGPFAMAGDKITGTEQFRFDRSSRQLARGPIEPVASATETDAEGPRSRVTGEGISAGLKITGDDWDRGERVTGTEGASARRRNPSRPGAMGAMPSFQRKRNEEVPAPTSRVTGASGNTLSGSLITVSGGARG